MHDGQDWRSIDLFFLLKVSVKCGRMVSYILLITNAAGCLKNAVKRDTCQVAKEDS